MPLAFQKKNIRQQKIKGKKIEDLIISDPAVMMGKPVIIGKSRGPSASWFDGCFRRGAIVINDKKGVPSCH